MMSWERPLQRLFASFPSGWPGVALLLLRTVIGLDVFAQGVFYVIEPKSSPAAWFGGLIAVAGCLLLFGCLTPLAGLVAGFGRDEPVRVGIVICVRARDPHIRHRSGAGSIFDRRATFRAEGNHHPAAESGVGTIAFIPALFPRFAQKQKM